MRFSKYHGLGNDFIFIEDCAGELVEKGAGGLARKLCHRNFGIGGDGLVFITKMMGLYTMRILMRTEVKRRRAAMRCGALPIICLNGVCSVGQT